MKDNNFKKNRKNGVDEPRINQELRFHETVRLVYTDSEGNAASKVMPISEAFSLSKERSLDLIEVNGRSNPPIVKLYDYSKYLYELKRANKAKNKNTVSCKEVQLSVNIGQHDLEVKASKAREFIGGGNKVKVVLTMRGRELGRRELSKESFRKFIEMVSDVAVLDSPPRDEGNKVIGFLKKK